ncbi:MAG: anthranilate synthase component I family protein, partial [Gammaproteobacteria bacterium]
QVVLSRRFTEKYTVSPFTIYQALCQISPAPYMFFIPLTDRVIIGASPERLIAVNQGTVSINPIAGTRRRDNSKTEQDIEQDLLSDSKEIAEHMMLVDLARNDIGAVCKPGSIVVEELLKVKHFSHISHITSLVTGKLERKYDALDALAHAFPAGTLSGAPKIRAMEIIDELETSRRGLYGGAICRLDYAGNLDTCIAIRMAILKDGIATVRTGGGIVYDSSPLAEADETRHKARNMLETIRIAQYGV